MRNALVGLVILGALGIAAYCLFRPHSPSGEDRPAIPQGTVWFEDTAVAAGLDFKLYDPATPQHQIIETIGSGLGWIDYDNDGWPDLLCIQAGPVPPRSDPSKTHKFFRNNRDGTFSDVTAAVGLNKSGFGQGCAVGDYDNDGFDDLLITYYGSVSLFHNVADSSAPGGRRFEDVTAASQIRNTDWGTSCAWGDLDNDGLLDLYICNYVVSDSARPLLCKDEVKGMPIACNPSSYPHAAHRLFRNSGNGAFEDITQSSGLASITPEAGLAVAIFDFDGDGRADIYVANDLGPAYFLHNLGAMKFEEIALRTGTAFAPGGSRMSGMGIEVADFDGSGRPSLFVTNFQRSPNVMFLNRGNLRFDDATFQSGLGGPSMDRLKFGVCGLDANLDGIIDLAVSNGHVQRAAREVFGVPYAQEAQFFLGQGGGKYRDASSTAGSTFLKPRVGRGLARADYDNDGKQDLAMSAIGENVALFHNRTETVNGWLSLELVGDGKRSNRNAIGAELLVEWAGKKTRLFQIGGGSYLSANERRLTVGLGESPQLELVTVRWPSGHEQSFRNLPAKTRWKLVEGQSQPLPIKL